MHFIFLFSLQCFSKNCNDSATVYNQVKCIINSSIPDKRKLYALQGLKNGIDIHHNRVDSGYVYLLTKLSKYYFIVNQTIDSAIQYNLLAIEINNSIQFKLSNYKLVNAYYNLGVYYWEQQHNSVGLFYFDTVILFNFKYDPDNYLFDARLYRASIYFFKGDYQNAINEYEVIINNDSLKNNNDSSYLITSLNFQAQAYLFQNEWAQALAKVEKVLPLAKQKQLRYDLATAYKTKAFILEKQQKYSQSEFNFISAIKERMSFEEKINKLKNGAIARDYNDLGNFYQRSLENYGKADECYRTTIKYANKISDKNECASTLFMAYENLAMNAVKKNEINKATQYYQTSLASINLVTSNFLFNNPTADQLIASVQNDELTTSFLFGKVNLLLKLYNKNKNKIYLKACLETALFADSVITQMRYQQAEEKSKLYWRNETRDFFNSVIETCYLSADANKAFYFLERSRAVLLNDQLSELDASSTLSSEDTQEKEKLETKLVQLQQQLLVQTPSSSAYYEVEKKALQTKDSLEHFIKSLEKKYPLYYQYKYADDVPSLQSLQKYVMQHNQSFVYYFMNDSAMYALAITKNKTNFIKIPASDFNNQQLFQFIRLCSDKQQLNGNYPLYCSLSQTIYKKLFELLQIPKGNVAICTDNFFIPFEALCSDDKGKDFLLNDYNFSYVYSARSLMKPFATKAASGDFIGFAPVSFSSSLAVPDLQQSATALQNTAQFYSNSTLFTGEQASRQSFFSNASKYSVVTIFSHAKADTTDAEPELFMQDAVIHLSELQRLNNPSIQFVLLSACQTNIGKNATGEGIYSLARGFASAGISAVSATLWKADEETIYQISTKFNEYLSQGMNKSEALQKAKLWYLQNADHEHTMPYYWANIVLIGSSQPIVLTSSSHLWLWVSAIVVGFVFTAFLVYRFSFKNKRITTPNNK